MKQYVFNCGSVIRVSICRGKRLALGAAAHLESKQKPQASGFVKIGDRR